MAKNTFATIGILSVLLLSLTLTAAATENGFEIAVTGAGENTDNRISGDSGDVVTFTVEFTNENESYETIDLILSGVDITSQEQTITGNDTLTVSFTIPTTQATQSRTLTGVVNASGETIATISDSVYYTVGSDSTTDADTLCEYEGYTEKGYLEISDFDVNNKGEGGDDEWEFLDEIEVTVEVENTDNDNIDDVEVLLTG